MSSQRRNVLDIKKAAARRGDTRRAPTMHAPKALRLKTRRRRQRLFMFCICLMGAAGLLGGVAGASHLQQFAVSDISVTGASAIPVEAVVSSVENSLTDGGFRFFSRKNMFLYPRSTIENTLSAEFPRIKGVTIARTSLLASAVVVAVEEREPFAKWCADACYVMDSSGFIYALEGGAPESPYVFSGGLAPGEAIGQTFLRGRLQSIVTLLHDLEKEGFTARGITVDTEKDFTVILESNLKLLVSFEMAPSDIIRNLETALEAEGLREKLDTLEYIDLRFGNRVYYKQSGGN